MPKSMTELVEDKVCDIFTEFKTSHSLVQYITDGMPIALAGYLQEQMLKSGEEKVEYAVNTKNGTLMTFILECIKRGDSLSINPKFEMGALGQSLVDSDSVKFDSDDLDAMALHMADDKEFLNALTCGYSCRQFKDGEWKLAKDDVHGLRFSEECDAAVCAAAYFTVLVEVLCNYKDLTNEAAYDVPGLGTFKIIPSKDGFNIDLVFSKDYKANTKSDILSNKMGAK